MTIAREITQAALIDHAASIQPSLVRAVIRQFGGWKDFTASAPDVTAHGIDGGFSGFIYHYPDTVPFTKRNRAAILELCESMREDLGEPDTLAGFVAGFRCLNMTAREVEGVLMDHGALTRDGDRESDAVQVYNALAWFAAEEVCRVYCDMVQEEGEP